LSIIERTFDFATKVCYIGNVSCLQFGRQTDRFHLRRGEKMLTVVRIVKSYGQQKFVKTLSSRAQRKFAKFSWDHQQLIIDAIIHCDDSQLEYINKALEANYGASLIFKAIVRYEIDVPILSKMMEADLSTVLINALVDAMKSPAKKLGERAVDEVIHIVRKNKNDSDLIGIQADIVSRLKLCECEDEVAGFIKSIKMDYLSAKSHQVAIANATT
jgi:hypothetical protein